MLLLLTPHDRQTTPYIHTYIHRPLLITLAAMAHITLLHDRVLYLLLHFLSTNNPHYLHLSFRLLTSDDSPFPLFCIHSCPALFALTYFLYTRLSLRYFTLPLREACQRPQRGTTGTKSENDHEIQEKVMTNATATALYPPFSVYTYMGKNYLYCCPA